MQDTAYISPDEKLSNRETGTASGSRYHPGDIQIGHDIFDELQEEHTPNVVTAAVTWLSSGRHEYAHRNDGEPIRKKRYIRSLSRRMRGVAENREHQRIHEADDHVNRKTVHGRQILPTTTAVSVDRGGHQHQVRFVEPLNRLAAARVRINDIINKNVRLLSVLRKEAL